MATKVQQPSKEIIELISSKFKTPDEFVTMYNAFIMGRLKDKDSELEDWFNRIDEDKLDEASNYYLTNERLKKFTHDLHSIKRKCKTRDQREMFNRLLAEFGMGSENKAQIEVPKEISNESVVKSFCHTKGQRKAFNELIKTFSEDTKELLKEANRDLKDYNELIDFINKNKDKIQFLFDISGAMLDGSDVYDRGYYVGKSKKSVDADLLISIVKDKISKTKKQIEYLENALNKEEKDNKFRKDWLSKILKKFKFDPKKVQISQYWDALHNGEYCGFTDKPYKSLEYICIVNISNKENPFEELTGDVTNLIKEAKSSGKQAKQYLDDNLAIKANEYGWLSLYIPTNVLK